MYVPIMTVESITKLVPLADYREITHQLQTYLDVSFLSKASQELSFMSVLPYFWLVRIKKKIMQGLKVWKFQHGKKNEIFH